MAIKFHETLHGLRVVRVTSDSSFEAKLIQQLMSMREEVLCEIFLDPHKAYDDLDRGH